MGNRFSDRRPPAAAAAAAVEEPPTRREPPINPDQMSPQDLIRLFGRPIWSYNTRTSLSIADSPVCDRIPSTRDRFDRLMEFTPRMTDFKEAIAIDALYMYGIANADGPTNADAPENWLKNLWNCFNEDAFRRTPQVARFAEYAKSVCMDTFNMQQALRQARIQADLSSPFAAAAADRMSYGNATSSSSAAASAAASGSPGTPGKGASSRSASMGANKMG